MKYFNVTRLYISKANTNNVHSAFHIIDSEITFKVQHFNPEETHNFKIARTFVIKNILLHSRQIMHK